MTTCGFRIPTCLDNRRILHNVVMTMALAFTVSRDGLQLLPRLHQRLVFTSKACKYVSVAVSVINDGYRLDKHSSNIMTPWKTIKYFSFILVIRNLTSLFTRVVFLKVRKLRGSLKAPQRAVYLLLPSAGHMTATRKGSQTAGPDSCLHLQCLEIFFSSDTESLSCHVYLLKDYLLKNYTL